MSLFGARAATSRTRRCLAAAGGLLAGCQLWAGLEDDYNSVIPAGWHGPVQIVESSSNPGNCPSVELGKGYRELQVAAATCDCVVGQHACTPQLLRWDDTAVALECLQLVPDEKFDLTPGTCVAVSFINSYLKVTTKPLTEVLCETQAVVAPPTWGSSARFCSARPTAAGVCITRDGEQDCPPGPFTQRRVFHSGFDDQRRCECGHSLGTCSGFLGIVDIKDFSDPLTACQGNVVSSQTTLNACAGPLDARYLKFSDTSTSLSCSVTNTDALAGDVSPTEPITACCRP